MELFFLIFFLLTLVGSASLLYFGTLIYRKTVGMMDGWRYLAFYALSYLPDTIALCLPLPWSLPWSLPLHCGFASSSRPCGRAPGIVARYRRPASPPGIVNAVVILRLVTLRRNPSGVRSAPMPFLSTSLSRSRRSWRSAIKTIPRPASFVALWSATLRGARSIRVQYNERR